jgi:hypothetical protein
MNNSQELASNTVYDSIFTLVFNLRLLSRKTLLFRVLKVILLIMLLLLDFYIGMQGIVLNVLVILPIKNYFGDNLVLVFELGLLN